MHYLQLMLQVLPLLWQRFIVHKSILLSELVSAKLAAQILKPRIAALTAEQPEFEHCCSQVLGSDVVMSGNTY